MLIEKHYLIEMKLSEGINKDLVKKIDVYEWLSDGLKQVIKQQREENNIELYFSEDYPSA